MFTCEAVDLGYLDTAPIRISASINVDRPPSEVFAALAHDPANWGEFFPGFDRTGRFFTPAPHGVGSRYTKRLIGINIVESVLVWDEGARLAFRVDSTTAPAFHAWVEDYRCESDGHGGTLLRVAIGGKPRLAFKLAAPVLQPIFTRLMTRVGHNLERGRWFSTPRINP
ncbi:SRPBCC family protein [Mycobacterium sp.]|uniref:SRPBCC family protein n=1 Tax=Mycobacterium sp. TaxID=1785 RepID=UPI003BAFC542